MPLLTAKYGILRTDPACHYCDVPVTYTAADIRVLTDQEVDVRFTWARVGALAERYSRPTGWIARGLEACRRANVDPDYFIARYLERDTAIPFDTTVDEAMREILAEARVTDR